MKFDTQYVVVLDGQLENIKQFIGDDYNIIDRPEIYLHSENLILAIRELINTNVNDDKYVIVTGNHHVLKEFSMSMLLESKFGRDLDTFCGVRKLKPSDISVFEFDTIGNMTKCNHANSDTFDYYTTFKNAILSQAILGNNIEYGCDEIYKMIARYKIAVKYSGKERVEILYENSISKEQEAKDEFERIVNEEFEKSKELLGDNVEIRDRDYLGIRKSIPTWPNMTKSIVLVFNDKAKTAKHQVKSGPFLSTNDEYDNEYDDEGGIVIPIASFSIYNILSKDDEINYKKSNAAHPNATLMASARKKKSSLVMLRSLVQPIMKGKGQAHGMAIAKAPYPGLKK